MAAPNGSGLTEARSLLDSLRDDLQETNLDAKRRDAALTQLKVLGRNPSNVASLYDKSGIEVLSKYAFGSLAASTRQEALRCLANALLLLPQTRTSAVALQLDQRASDAFSSADGDDDEFLLSRLLFLMTYEPSFKAPPLILEHGLAISILRHVERHAGGSNTSMTSLSSATSMSTMAMSETLKLLFNVSNANPDHGSEFSPAIPHLLVILDQIELPSPPLQPPITLVLNALATLKFDTPSLEASPVSDAAMEKLVAILEQAVTKYSTTELETSAIPLLTVLRSINEAADTETRAKMKSRLLPDDSERDQPLGKSSSLSSRLLQLTTSAGLMHLPAAISGLMFELSEKDANQYVANVGYGYAAGYLMTHNIPMPESAKQSQQGGPGQGQAPINPITGQRLEKEPVDDLPEMTQEEKEREAERLFVLFERLKATGVVDVKNPAEAARDAGRFEELSDSDPD